MVNDGVLDVNLSGGTWVLGIGETLTMNSVNGTAELLGSTLEVRGNIAASGGDTSRVRAPLEFSSTGSTHVDADSSFSVIADLTFQGGSTHTGEGAFRVSRDVIVNGDTVVDMPNGDFELDNRNGDQTVELHRDWTLNVDSLAGEVGSEGGGQFTFNIDNGGAKLEVNLTDPDAEWTLGADGVINVTGAATLSTSLAGSDVNIKGTINVNNNTRFDARLDVEEGGRIELQSNTLFMYGGDQADPNRIHGGLIAGSGVLNAFDNGLYGYGVVAPDLNFTGGADLYADGGRLQIQGAIQSADLVGAKSSGILSLSQTLDTSNVEAIEMEGGSIIGADIHNNGITRGFGTIASNGFVNDGFLTATGGGQLIIDTVTTPDLDGASGNGIMQALSGDLVIVGSVAPFQGSASVAAGMTMEFQQNWELASDGSLLLQGSGSETAVLAGSEAKLLGQVTVVGPSRIASPVVFSAGSQTSLNGSNSDLRLDNTSVINPEAAFSGTGRVSNLDGSTTILGDGVVVDARFSNQGALLFLSGPGQAEFAGFEQTPTGELLLNFDGTASGEFGQILVNNGASLDGSLDVNLSLSFTPELNDEFPIIRTMSGITGQFAQTDFPNLPSGLGWQLDYSDPQTLWLRVISVVSGDFDGDGDYACADIDRLVAEIVAGTNQSMFDLTGDGLVDQADLTAWLSEAGNAEIGPGATYLVGDSNLDGNVDTSDFNIWNANKFTSNASWCSGDFNADGSIDTSDFNAWNGNKFQSSDSVSAVPEPAGNVLFVGLIGLLGLRRSRG